MEKVIFDSYPNVSDGAAERAASDFFLRIGILPSLTGFYQAVKCAQLCFRCRGKCSLTKDVYRMVGKSCLASPQSVERNIRSAIERACDEGTIFKLNELLGADVVPQSGFITVGQLLGYAKAYLTRILVYETESKEELAAYGY